MSFYAHAIFGNEWKKKTAHPIFCPARHHILLKASQAIEEQSIFLMKHDLGFF